MTDVQFRSDVTVLCTRVEGEDLDIARAAWVSTKGQRAKDEQNSERVSGLINMMMRDRHGSPFEQVGMQFLTTAPIFVWREHMRHRIASYNEMSGRYTQLPPMFYIPDRDRALIQKGKPGAYTFEAAPQTSMMYEVMVEWLKQSSVNAYVAYETMMELGIAKEVSRMTLPVNIYSTAYVRMNLRALMNFLSLRTKSLNSAFPSFPQREIEMVAELYEGHFSNHFPLTYTAFCKNGRVAP